MKVSELTIQDLKEYAREYNDDPEVDKLFTSILVACKAYIKGYTGLDATKVDNYEDLTVVALTLSSELYDRRTFIVESDKVNPLVKSILDMYSINLL